MPSCAGVGLWLPEVGGFVLYVTLLVVWLRPSDLNVLKVHPAAVASAARFEVSALLLLPPPASATIPITTITATTSTTAPPICSVRLREADLAAASSASWRSRRRRSFSS